MTAMLEVSGLSVRFGGVHALNAVDLTVERGQLVGLIGPNGAGKTTCIDAISGFVRASAGTIRFAGTEVTRAPAHRRARLGLGRTWQGVQLFADLTVGENLQIGFDHPLGHTGQSAHTMKSLCALLGIPDVLDRFPAGLSHGQQKLVGVARALAAGPLMLCLDEPAAGLDTEESLELGNRLRRVCDDGTAILLVDHDMGLVMGVCDELSVLEFGTVIASGTPAQVRADPAVIAAYLGTTALVPYDERSLL